MKVYVVIATNFDNKMVHIAGVAEDEGTAQCIVQDFWEEHDAAQYEGTEVYVEEKELE